MYRNRNLQHCRQYLAYFDESQVVFFIMEVIHNNRELFPQQYMEELFIVQTG